MVRDDRRRMRQRQHGSIYLMVLGSSLIVTVIGLSALAAVRVERMSSQVNRDLAQARLLARSAIDLGMLQIRDDPRWRQRGPGVWISDLTLGAGLLSLEAIDPQAGNFQQPDGPAVLVGTGRVGAARYVVRTELTTARGLPCLENAMHSGREIIFDATTVANNQMVSANRDIEAKGGSTVYGDVESAHNVLGGTYMGQTASSAPERTIPDVATVLAYYLANGTAIQYADLPTTGPNLLTNTGMEDGIAPWVDRGFCKLDVSADQPHGGNASLRVSDRAAPWAGPLQDIRDQVVNDAQYTAEAWVRLAYVPEQMKITVWVRDDDGDHWHSGNLQAVGTAWTKITAQFPINWKGDLQHCMIYVETGASNQRFYVDDMSLRRIEPGGPGIRRVVLSPAHNPFGSGQTNAQGIYVINCNANRIEIADARIVGTLVLLNLGSGSRIGGAVAWEPARPNFPALLVSGSMTIAHGSAGLSEADFGINFNPAGAAFPFPEGESDGDSDDGYPSIVRGLVYVSGNIELANHPTFDGVVLAGLDVIARGPGLDLRYRPTFLNDPPPGFDQMVRTVELVAGSWRRIVD